MNKIMEFIDVQIAFFTGEITYSEYSSFFRRKDNMIIQAVILFLFLLMMSFIYNIPLHMTIWATIVLIYGAIMQSKAKTTKQQLLYSFIWAFTSFIVSAILLFLAVSFGFL